MKNALLSLLLTLSVLHSTTQKNFAPTGFCCVPVADLIGAPIGSFFNLKDIKKAYTKIPYGDKRGDFACPRVAQLLFNEPVEILERKAEEVKIRAPHITYPVGNKVNDTYWTLASNICPLTKKHIKGVPLAHKKTVTLSHPLTNKNTGHTYSIGTRFVKTPGKQTRKKHIVYMYNKKTNTFDTATIAKTWCLSIPKNKQKKQKLFVELCKEWAHQKRGFIPYVFGGTSVSMPMKQDSFLTVPVTFTKKPATFYERRKAPAVRTGIDCARLFYRAAQMLNLPLNTCNTRGFKQALRPLTKGQKIENGDFILWKGHIAMVSDTKKALLVEARSYQDLYGKVHEIPFSEQFKEIKNVKDLTNAHFSKKPITRLNRLGKKSHMIYDLEVLKFSSIWNA